MKKLNFLIGIHCHQPVGNFDHVFEESYQNSYLPFIEVLEAHPSVKMSLHYSGPLLDWMEKERPEFLKKLQKMVKKGQIEMLGGGYYEPILSALPEEDAVGQLEMMNTFIKKKFGVKPEGVWLTERIWDPSMPKVLKKAGIEYTLLDDTHFYYAGLKPEQMFNYYMTEKHGSTLSVFPIHKSLRYSMPFQVPEETFSFLRGVWEQGNTSAVTFGDDGEKFGVWPGTNKWVYEDKWLENFFKGLEENSDWLQTVTFSEHIKNSRPEGRLYLPMASYEEMMEWSLPADVAERYSDAVHEIDAQGKRDAYLPFLRGGLWDNFFSKYEESNIIHKKMLLVSERTQRVNPKNKDAVKALYKGQCNCAYWHGLFGGLYLNYLRDGLYRNLIEAENILDAEEFKGKDFLSVEEADFTKDGDNEVLVSNQYINAYLSPTFGGSLFLFDFKSKSFCLSNVLSRRYESYHKKILDAGHDDGGEAPKSIHDIVKVKEEGLESYLHYDDVPKFSFMDKIYPATSTFQEYAANAEPLIDLSGSYYNHVLHHEKKKKAVKTVFTKAFVLPDFEEVVEIEKSYEVGEKDSGISVTYHLKNLSARTVTFRFGFEVTMTLLAPNADDRYVQVKQHRTFPNERSALAKVKDYEFVDEWNKFKVKSSFSDAIDLWITPLETVSQSEDGFERNYQGTTFFASKVVKLAPEKGLKLTNRLDCLETK